MATTLGTLRRGSGDPTTARTPDGAWWRTTRTPDGPATQVLRVDRAAADVVSQSWGPGADWVADGVPGLLGAGDDPAGFDPGDVEFLQRAWRRHGPGWRVPRTERALEALVAAVIEQKVTGKEAWRTWRSLLRLAGEPAPGPAPAGMLVFPTPDRLRQINSWQWHQVGLEAVRVRSVVAAAVAAPAVEACASLPGPLARQRLQALPGVGVWTAAEVAVRAFGDADAVSYGDYHVARDVVRAFTGRDDGTDADLAEVLAPYAGHRYRVQRMVELAGVRRERHGPRAVVRDYRRI